MYNFTYSKDKDRKLQKERFISFDDIIVLINGGYLLDILEHPNQDQYPGQKIYVLDVDRYVWLIPYIQKGNEIFLKTAFPSRKFTKLYNGRRKWDIN